jgi:hypothetical protein
VSDHGLQHGSDIENSLSLARLPRFNNWAIAADVWPLRVPSAASKLMFESLCEFKLPKSFLLVRIKNVALSRCYLIAFLPVAPWVSIA